VETILLVLGVAFVVCLAGYVLYSLIKVEAESKASIARAWAEARTQLRADPDTEARVIEYGNALGSFRIRHVEEGLGNSRHVYTVCEVHGLRGLSGVSLRVRDRDLTDVFSTRFAGADALPEFVENQQVNASPAYLATEFFDRATQELICRSLLSFTTYGGILRIRVDESMYATPRIVRLAQEAEQLAARWRAMLAGLQTLPGRLGFDEVPPQLRLSGVSLLGQAVRRGRTWYLELSGTNDACEVVLRTGEAPLTTLRFPGLSRSPEPIAQALEAAEAELATGAYR